MIIETSSKDIDRDVEREKETQQYRRGSGEVYDRLTFPSRLYTYHGELGEEFVGLEDWSTGVAEAGVHVAPAAETYLEERRSENEEEKTSLKPRVPRNTNSAKLVLKVLRSVP